MKFIVSIPQLLRDAEMNQALLRSVKIFCENEFLTGDGWDDAIIYYRLGPEETTTLQVEEIEGDFTIATTVGAALLYDYIMQLLAKIDPHHHNDQPAVVSSNGVADIGKESED